MGYWLHSVILGYYPEKFDLKLKMAPWRGPLTSDCFLSVMK